MTKYLLHITFLAIGLVAVLLLSCRKEVDSLLQITAESFGGDNKLLVDGKYATWETGDLIRINGTTAEVVRNDNGHAYIPALAASDVNMALFPSTLAGTIDGEVVTINLPSEYRYKTSGGQQVLPLPMAAVSAAESPLHFRHLTGALMLTVEGNMILESITVISDKYQLSGSRTLRFDNIGGQEPVVSADVSQRRVSMLFDALAVTSSVDVLIPIAAVGADNHFTIEIEARREGTRYHFHRTQTTGGALQQNVLAYTATTVIGNDSTTTGPLFSGAGEPSNPFLISSPSDLRAMVDAVNIGWKVPGAIKKTYSMCWYKLTDSIDMQGSSIVTMDTLYNGGCFDGNGYAIKNLTINSVLASDNKVYCGLFGKIRDGSVVKDLILRNITLKHVGNSSNEVYISPLCAMSPNCSIYNCTVSGVTLDITGTTGTIHSGSMVGCVKSGESKIIHCTFSGMINIQSLPGNLYLGGITGRIDENASMLIDSCTVVNQTLDIAFGKTLHIGGLVGAISSSCTLAVANTSWNGNMTINSGTSSYYVGGVVGRCLTNSAKLTVNCDLSGSISTSGTGLNPYLGAFLGSASGTGYTLPPFPSGLTLTKDGSPINKRIGNGS